MATHSDLIWLCAALTLPAALWPESGPARDAARPVAATIADRYQAPAKRIIETALANKAAYRKLEVLCDDIGHRLSGSPELEKAVQWALETLQADGHENVHAEPVTVPHWVRGRESLALVAPREMALPMLGLGGSVGTPPDGITAEVVVVADEQGLEAAGERVRGRIVLFNNPMPPYNPENGAGYGHTVRFRGKGARLASEKGAVACLVRSVTARSLRSPHTGAMSYRDARVRIPAAAITTEDADMLARMQARGGTPIVCLKMGAKTHGQAESANVIAELRGRERPEEIVVIGGHIDSWDVGQGAHDDGTGVVMAMEALTLLRRLGLVPRRTVRVVLWTNEENGLGGGKAYAAEHKEEMARHVAAIESDSGGFRPIGYSVGCKDADRQAAAAEQMRDIIRLLEPIGATELTVGGWGGADISPMKDAGVVLMGHRVEGSTYFDYHHTHADTLDKVDPGELAQNVAAMATIAYVIADMPERLGSSN